MRFRALPPGAEQIALKIVQGWSSLIQVNCEERFAADACNYSGSLGEGWPAHNVNKDFAASSSA